MATATKKSSGSKGGKKSSGSKGARQPRLHFKPITKFLIPTHSWAIESEQPIDAMKLEYSQPEQVQRMGRPLLRIEVTRGEGLCRYIYVPARYEQLWRHLRYSILYWEKAIQWYKEKLTELGPSLNEREAEVETLRNNAGVKYIQYMICQRQILQELIKIRFDNPGEFSLPTFLEFGVRHFRDWLHDDFGFAKKQGAKFLAMNPTLKSNVAKLKAGYHGKLPAEMDPPQHDDWWGGNFDLSSLFSKHFEDALDVMTEEEFEDSRLQLADEGQEPWWSEAYHPAIPFFSSSFDQFLSEGKDPHRHPKEYLRFYLVDNGELEVVKDMCWAELAILLGDKYQRRAESWDNRIAALGDQYTWREFVDEVLAVMADHDEEMGRAEEGATLGEDEEEQRGQEVGVEGQDDEGNGGGNGDENDNDKGGQGDNMDVDKVTQNQDGDQVAGPSNPPLAAEGAPSFQSVSAPPANPDLDKPTAGDDQNPSQTVSAPLAEPTNSQEAAAAWDQRRGDMLR